MWYESRSFLSALDSCVDRLDSCVSIVVMYGDEACEFICVFDCVFDCVLDCASLSTPSLSTPTLSTPLSTPSLSTPLSTPLSTSEVILDNNSDNILGSGVDGLCVDFGAVGADLGFNTADVRCFFADGGLGGVGASILS